MRTHTWIVVSTPALGQASPGYHMQLYLLLIAREEGINDPV